MSEPQIELIKVDKHYGSYHALRNIDLTIDKGTFVALVGPSGCGKSTLLRSLAGLESISSGTMKIGGEVMNKVPPRKRDVAMVFQSYALYPHMSVRDNLTYSLRLKRMPKDDANKAAEQVAETIGLSALMHRYPRELSGGQRQRVAMGRAIVRHPKAFLFDEPLSNLDAALRVHMRKEIRSLHDRLGATSVYVTHDQIEAMTMADYVVVMRTGVIEQQGRPLDLYDRPANKFVAGFIGSPAMNFVAGTVGADGRSVTLDLSGAPSIAVSHTVEPGRKVVVGMRPEHLLPSDTGGFEIEAGIIESTGSVTWVTTATTPPLTVVLTGRATIAPRQHIRLAIAPESVHLFDAETEKAIER